MRRKLYITAILIILILLGTIGVEAKGTPDYIVVLDPGHGGIDGGASATHNGVTYIERDINLKIAKYCKSELEKYQGVTVYMTRSDNSTKLDLAERVEIADKLKADFLISIHNNSSVSSGVNGVEVIIPNNNYNINSIYERSLDLGIHLVEELSSLGLKNRGVYYKMCTDGELYPDGSLADYYGIINRSKKKGFPGLIIEHAFISNKADATTYLGTEEMIKSLGVADATAIAEYLGLTKGVSVEQGIGGIWQYCVDNTVDESYTGLVKKDEEWWYVENGQVDFTEDAIVQGITQEYWYVNDGKVDLNYNGVAEGGYISNGQLDQNINGYVKKGEAIYYFENGNVVTSLNGVYEYEGTMYYFQNGEADLNYTGVGKDKTGIWYIENGIVDYDKEGLERVKDDMYYFTGGKWNDNVTGIIENELGWWYVEQGKVNFEIQAIVRDEVGYAYVNAGKVATMFSGILFFEDCYWYIKDGFVDQELHGIISYENNEYFFEKGRAYCEEARLIWYKGNWYYIENGIYQKDYTGLVEFEDNLWYVKQGIVDRTYTGTLEIKNESWYIEAGRVVFQNNGEEFIE